MREEKYSEAKNSHPKFIIDQPMAAEINILRKYFALEREREKYLKSDSVEELVQTLDRDFLIKQIIYNQSLDELKIDPALVPVFKEAKNSADLLNKLKKTHQQELQKLQQWEKLQQVKLRANYSKYLHYQIKNFSSLAYQSSFMHLFEQITPMPRALSWMLGLGLTYLIGWYGNIKTFTWLVFLLKVYLRIEKFRVCDQKAEIKPPSPFVNIIPLSVGFNLFELAAEKIIFATGAATSLPNLYFFNQAISMLVSASFIFAARLLKPVPQGDEAKKQRESRELWSYILGKQLILLVMHMWQTIQRHPAIAFLNLLAVMEAANAPFYKDLTNNATDAWFNPSSWFIPQNFSTIAVEWRSTYSGNCFFRTLCNVTRYGFDPAFYVSQCEPVTKLLARL